MRKRDDVDDDDHRLQPARRFVDVGPAIDDRYRPVVSANPEQTLAALAEIFLGLGRDYAGPLPEGFALRAVAQKAAVLHAAEMEKQAGKARRGHPVEAD